jgi:F-type H+-transporting ATPase subunit epsilon
MPINLEIVSPERLLVSRPVDMVVIPGSEGDLGALPGHAPMMLLLRGGIVSLYENGQVTDRLFVTGGFAEVTPERVTVLADETFALSELSRTEGERRLAAAQAEYDAADKADVAAIEAAMDHMLSARAMIQAAPA